MRVWIPSFTSTITVRKNYIFGKQILSILTIDIVLHILVLVHLCIPMPVLLVVVLLLASITSTCAIECGQILRAYRAPPGGSFVRLNFLCNLLLLSLKDRMSNGLLIIKRLPELLKLVA